VRPVGYGWDNAAYLVNDAYVFRFPRRTIAVGLIEKEARILPRIAPALPAPITAPCFAGVASREYPWPFSGYPALGGVALSALRPTTSESVGVARDLGAFVRALHAVDCAPLLAAGLPGDVIGRLDHPRMRPKVVARLAELESAGLLRDAAPPLELLDRIAPGAPRLDRRTVVHGDLYARHVLTDARLRLCGVIDWGDVHFGEPALDLSAAVAIFEGDARDAFFAAYGPVDDATLELARYRAVYHSAMVAHYGHRIGDADLVHIGLRGLRVAQA
jgi:aminoglycoside phosphotransferase (APT) family kinase protein